MEVKFGNIEEYLYEQRAANRILVRVSFRGIESPRIAYSSYVPMRQGVYDAMGAAIQRGLISEDEYDDLTNVDIIVHGRNRRHAVVEISLSLDEDDIARAIRRSDILNRAIGEEVTPMVATPAPLPAFIQEAERRNVVVLDIPV